MIVFKGTDRDMFCTKGHGSFKYELGKTYTEEASKVARTGLHVSEYVMEVVYWYPPEDGGRIFICEAGGSIDEDESDKVSCTELTLIRELNREEIVFEALMYMIQHPLRKFDARGKNYQVARNRAECGRDGIAIARGIRPKARGGKGAILGFMDEVSGKVRMRMVGGDGLKPETWYVLKGGEVIEDETGRDPGGKAAEAPEG